MAEYRITYWRDIPSMVTARDDAGATAKGQLPDRCQELIDQRAMDLGLAGTNEYLEQWRLGDWEAADGAPDHVAAAVAARLDEEFAG
jgi:hypothetical protein